VIASRNYKSLMDHLGSGKAWDLSRKSDGLFILTPLSNRENTGIYRGKVEALKSSMDYIRKAKQEYCVLTSTGFIFNTNFDDMMRFHIESGADITILYHRVSKEHQVDDQFDEIYLDIDDSGRVSSVQINPMLTGQGVLSMKTYILRKDMLIYLVEETFAKGGYKFSENLIRDNTDRLKIMAFEHKGYVGTLKSVASYFRLNMSVLDANIRGELFSAKNRIYTKVKDSVPAKYMENAVAKNVLVSNGCIIEGYVENSVLSREVHIGKGAVVKNSIILSNTVIYEGAELEYTVLDKNVNVRPRSRLVGNAAFPMVIRKGGNV